ncbi:hypothetical protein [Candidatus Neptunochlamydia vexilliferae]|nr:hypothetical protein [Candidatus Neptunochlamydia vexilliferae]
MATQMTRMSIDIPTKDHRRLKVLANSQGLTIREFVLTSLEPALHPTKKPNKETQKAMEDARKRKTIKANDFEDLCDKLGI